MSVRTDRSEWDYGHFADEAEVFDLSHSWFSGMPVAPVHPAYLLSLMRRHGDQPRDDGSCTANEVILMSGHTGTHIDALGHVSSNGKLAGGLDAEATQRGGAGLQALGVEQVLPIVCRGILLDLASIRGGRLDAAYEITAEDLEEAELTFGVNVRSGDAVLIRTGWGALWPDTRRFGSWDCGTPGPGPAAAQWLVDKGARVTGSDTLVFEVNRPTYNVRPVHKCLLVDSRIHILEALNLERASEARLTTFLFVAAPLKLVGATASPVAPLAIRFRNQYD